MNDIVKYELNDVLFTWDDEKAIKNWRKHKITFQLAAEVFFDAYAIDLPDRRHMKLEPRRKLIGVAFDSSNTLFVVYVKRESWDGEDVMRLISARPANRKEKEDYEAGISK